ncbi:hypothetical protein K440DRAFT_671244 [Wilcoxina mikolae CBS 423.85]|nr:hypothetical protein K440DRAFT_671244 [Wilcoxina mikolae CBS 423.85]
MSSRETTPTISSSPETADSPLTEPPSPDGPFTMEESETEEITVEPEDAPSSKITTVKANTRGRKRKASAIAAGPKEKKPRAKSASKSKEGSGEISKGWDPAHNSYILQAKKEGKTDKEITKGLESVFRIKKTPKAVGIQIFRLKARNFDWTDELETMLRESVKEFLMEKTNKYRVVCRLFKGKLKAEVQQEAVVAKLKAWEKEGEIEKLG